MTEDFGFGIDLGTTNSAVARSNGIDVRLYQNNDQMNVTSSAVLKHKNGRLIVGRRAYNALVEGRENVATEFKRSMGQKVRVTFPCCGHSLSPEELSAEVLKSLKDDVRAQTGEEITRAVITVPAAFGTLQCEATSQAGLLAGITETYLLQEPIAASIAYGVEPSAWNQRWLVVDLGGGTLDIAVISTRDGQLTVLENQGNNLLGGKDMDRIIVEQVFLPALAREFELPEPGSPERLHLVRRLAIRAEEAKIDLSTKTQVIVSLFGLGTDRRGTLIEAEVVLLRADFEKKIDPLVRTCVRSAQEALSVARLSGTDLDRVLLVGGPTQIPYVRAAIAEGIGAKIDFSIDPMTVVARGAAVFASGLEWRDRKLSTAAQGKLTLELGYEKVSSAIQPAIIGRVPSTHDVEAIKLDAEGGFWTSGWIPITDGCFDTQVRLAEGKLTRFWIYARRLDGTLVDLEPESLSIRHGLVPAAPPLPYSIGIEIVKRDGKSELDPIFAKGHSLPAERMVSYRAARELRATQPDDFLAVKIWEGETPEDPEANLWVGAMTIFGREIHRPIREGAEIQLTVKIDESRRISVDAFLPYSNESVSSEIYLPDREQKSPTEQMMQVRGAIEQLFLMLDGVEAATAHHEDPAASKEIEELRRNLEEVDLLASESASLSDDPDLASRLLERTRHVRRRIVVLQKGIGPGDGLGTEISKGRMEAAATKEVAEKFGSSLEKDELAMLVRDLESAGKRASIRSIRNASERVQALRWRVLLKQDWYWKESFEAQRRNGRTFVNGQEAQKWLEAGDEAVRKGDSLTLQEAVRHLWRLQPKPDVELDRERAMQAGLRGF